jgi:DnaJ-class molecular chaperone
MEQHQICTQCRGRKKHVPLGFMEVDCNLCKGYGFINKDLMPVIYPINDDTRLRKKKNKLKEHPLDALKNKLDLVNDIDVIT